MDIESKELLPPPFTLYPLTTQDLKSCYESETYKIICAINGPYFDRKHSELQPLFNVSINTSYCSTVTITPEEIVRLQKKVEEVLQTVMLAGRYQRMVFDVNFQTIEIQANNPPSFLLAPLLNLLSYTCALRGLETVASFACSALILRDQKIEWDYGVNQQKGTDRSLILCTDCRDRKSLLTIFFGEFGYIQFQRLSSAAQEVNQQLIKFQTEKVGEVFDLFNK